MVPFLSYVSRGKSKPRLIFSRINGPINVSKPSTSSSAMFISRVLKITDHDMSRTQW